MLRNAVGRKPKSASEKAEENRYLERLGRHLKELREAKNLTPQYLADKLGVTPQYIYMIESGRAKPSEKRLNDLARALGDLADEFLATAVTHVEDEFATKLREAGLSPDEIEEAARRVSAKAKRDVVSGEEPLPVARGDMPQGEVLSELSSAEDALEIELTGPSESSSAFDYAESIKDDFVGSAPTRSAFGMSRTPAPGRAERPIKAGPDAQIVVSRPVTREERKALQDIGKVIAHLLKQ